MDFANPEEQKTTATFHGYGKMVVTLLNSIGILVNPTTVLMMNIVPEYIQINLTDYLIIHVHGKKLNVNVNLWLQTTICA